MDQGDDEVTHPCLLEEIELTDDYMQDDIGMVADAFENDSFWLPPSSTEPCRVNNKSEKKACASTTAFGVNTGKPDELLSLLHATLHSPMVERRTVGNVEALVDTSFSSDVTLQLGWQADPTNQIRGQLVEQKKLSDSIQSGRSNQQPHVQQSMRTFNTPRMVNAQDPVLTPQQLGLHTMAPMNSTPRHGAAAFFPVLPEIGQKRPWLVPMMQDNRIGPLGSYPYPSAIAVSSSNCAASQDDTSSCPPSAVTPLGAKYIKSSRRSRTKCRKVSPASPVPPLTAYNFFFRFERTHLLRGNDTLNGDSQHHHHHDDPYAWIVANSKAFQEQTLLEQWGRDRTVKRKHAKSHGRISFHSLTEHVAQAWNTLPEPVKRVFHEIAARDNYRYSEEMKLDLIRSNTRGQLKNQV